MNIPRNIQNRAPPLESMGDENFSEHVGCRETKLLEGFDEIRCVLLGETAVLCLRETWLPTPLDLASATILMPTGLLQC